jgi:hypothetical protein
MHDLGDRGFHSRAVAGGKDDGGETGLAHRQLEADRKYERLQLGAAPPWLQLTDCCEV